MTGMDGINSLQKMLGALQVSETSNVHSTAATAAKTGKAAPSGAALSGLSDKASLSAAGGLAAQGPEDLSDVRLTKVAELRSAIVSGTYNVPAADVADKMVESLLG